MTLASRAWRRRKRAFSSILGVKRNKLLEYSLSLCKRLMFKSFGSCMGLPYFKTSVLENNPGCMRKKRASNHSFMSRSRDRPSLGKRLVRRYAEAFDSRALPHGFAPKRKGAALTPPPLDF